MQILSQELNKPILDRVQKAVEIVSERKKLNYVIDETVTLYFKGGMDITGEVLSELLKLDAEAMKK
jgi:Skp family chaperone for outer membrane proteins